MAAPEADPAERAKQEAEVLKLIFGDDVLDCKMYDCWKVNFKNENPYCVNKCLAFQTTTNVDTFC